MKKLRYGKLKPKRVEQPNKKQEYINKFLKRAEAVTTESEARKLLSEAWGKKNVFLELFGKVAEVLKSKGIFTNK
jgi:hypothetical protein